MSWYVGIRKNGNMRVFQDGIRPTKSRYQEFENVIGPFQSYTNAVYYIVEAGGLQENPPNHGVIIYDDIEAIEAQKGSSVNVNRWKGEHFRHKFKRGSAVIGLPDGSILIKNKKNKKLWKTFNYD